jgi:Protein of unknown function (DUF3489)
MKAFTIDAENNIRVFPTKEEAAASGTPSDSFATERELAELAAGWPGARLVAIWNSLPGVTSVKKFKDTKTATSRIWKSIQSLGSSDQPKAKGGSSKTKPAKKAGKRAKVAPGAGPRVGTKTAQVVEMLRRKNGATLAEIMEAMGWQKHTVRGFMAGAMKKAGFEIESFKPEGGERSYRINK